MQAFKREMRKQFTTCRTRLTINKFIFPINSYINNFNFGKRNVCLISQMNKKGGFRASPSFDKTTILVFAQIPRIKSMAFTFIKFNCN